MKLHFDKGGKIILREIEDHHILDGVKKGQIVDQDSRRLQLLNDCLDCGHLIAAPLTVSAQRIQIVALPDKGQCLITVFLS